MHTQALYTGLSHGTHSIYVKYLYVTYVYVIYNLSDDANKPTMPQFGNRALFI